MLCDECQTVNHCMTHGCIPKVKLSALNKQESGNHYKDKGIQPIVYIHANNLGFCAGNVVKYVTRYKEKNGAADIRKAIHYLELLLELEYKDDASNA
jgi:hypothetical protein